MVYELVLDITRATSPVYATNIGQLLTALIPTFSVHEREKSFSSIQLKCNLNAELLPERAILQKLQDLDGKVYQKIGGALIHFNSNQDQSISSKNEKKTKIYEQGTPSKLICNLPDTDIPSVPVLTPTSEADENLYLEDDTVLYPNGTFPAYLPPAHVLIEDEKNSHELEETVDDDYAFALQLLHEQNDEAKDMEIAMEMQMEWNPDGQFGRNETHQHHEGMFC